MNLNLILTLLAICPFINHAASAQALKPLLGDYSEGGTNGSGGGDTVDVEPLSEDSRDLIEEIKSSRPKILAYLYGKCHSIKGEWHCNSNTGLVNGMEPPKFRITPELAPYLAKMIPLIKQTKVTLMRNKPCYNLARGEHDGSAFVTQEDSSQAPGVCISLSRIYKKLTYESIHDQPLALIAHEYSHLAGASEEIAVKIQKLFICEFLKNYHYGFGDDGFSLEQMNFFRLLDNLKRELKKVRSNLDSSPFGDIYFQNESNDLLRQFKEITRALESYEKKRLLLIDRGDGTDSFTVAGLRLYTIAKAIEGIEPAFTRNKISFYDLCHYDYLASGNCFESELLAQEDSEIIYKIRTSAQAQAQIDLLLSFLDAVVARQAKEMHLSF